MKRKIIVTVIINILLLFIVVFTGCHSDSAVTLIISNDSRSYSGTGAITVEVFTATGTTPIIFENVQLRSRKSFKLDEGSYRIEVSSGTWKKVNFPGPSANDTKHFSDLVVLTWDGYNLISQ